MKTASDAHCGLSDGGRILAGGLAFIENHERFPSVADKVKMNFGFMFTAPGKAAYILSYVWLSI